MAPSVHVYLSEEDKKRLDDLKARGRKPSNILSKAISQEEKELDEKSKEMVEIQIYEGIEDITEEGVSSLKIIKFIGKKIAAGELDYEPSTHGGLHHVKQQLYLTRKQNFLLYEQVSQYEKIYYKKTIIEKGKPLPSMAFAPGIVEALGVQNSVGTFLDI